MGGPCRMAIAIMMGWLHVPNQVSLGTLKAVTGATIKHML